MTYQNAPRAPTPEQMLAADYALSFRASPRSLHPTAGTEELRRLFGLPLPEAGRDGREVIKDLIRAAEPGLVGNTQGGFFAWVMGGSHPTGVAADWLTSVWGQNAAIFQTSPAAAIAEEVSANWILDLLDLPRASSVGFTTGATMGGFIALAAARNEVLRWAGCDFEKEGLQGAPPISVFISDDAHASNTAVLHYLGFGARNLVPITTDGQGVMDTCELAAAMSSRAGPQIVLCQAGHINSGAFDDFAEIADLADRNGAWMHVDGAFGLWSRAVPEMKRLAAGVERAHSWAVDGHKWLQIPYDSGFAIVRDQNAHRRAMTISANYLNHAPTDGRNPTEYNPELSRRARGFAVWAMLQALGRDGVCRLVRTHCEGAKLIAEQLRQVSGIEVVNEVALNQVVACFRDPLSALDDAQCAEAVAQALNKDGRFFFRTADWKGRRVLRISVIAHDTDANLCRDLVDSIKAVWQEILSHGARSCRRSDS